jgi:hypothetical protein
MLKKLLLFCAILTFSLYGVGEDDVVVIDNEVSPQTQNDEHFVVDSPEIEEVRQENIFLSYVEKPKKIYVGEVFKITLKALIVDEFDKLSDALVGGKDFKSYKSGSEWRRLEENLYQKSFHFSLNSAKAVLPDIKVSIASKKLHVGYKTIAAILPTVIQIDGDKLYSGVVAQDLNVTNYKASVYDEKSNMIVMGLSALGSNLDQIRIKGIEQQGIDSSKEHFPFLDIYYFAVVPKSKNAFVFSYFNTTHNKFQKITIPITVDKEELSTQLEINPKDSKYHYYIKVSFGVMMGLLLLVYFFNKKIIYLLFALLLGAYLLYDRVSIKHVFIKAEAELRILPTENSTLFLVTDKKIPVESVKEYRDYTKVILQDGKIGWVRSEYVVKD